jgi:hypothetical protein
MERRRIGVGERAVKRGGVEVAWRETRTSEALEGARRWKAALSKSKENFWPSHRLRARAPQGPSPAPIATAAEEHDGEDSKDADGKPGMPPKKRDPKHHDGDDEERPGPARSRSR